MAEEKKPEEKKKSGVKQFFEDFKAFAVKGNVIDMAVGVVVGTAFTAIVNSLVGDILSPVIGKFTAGIDFKTLKWVLSEAVVNEAGEVTKPEVAIGYGNFIHNIVYFILVAFSVFILVRILKKSAEKAKENAAERKQKKADAAEAEKAEEKKEEPAPAPAPEPAPAPAPAPAPNDETAALLREIRDLLKAANGGESGEEKK